MGTVEWRSFLGSWSPVPSYHRQSDCIIFSMNMSDFIWKLVVSSSLSPLKGCSRVTFLWCVANFSSLQCHCDNFACVYSYASITVSEIILAAFYCTGYSLHSHIMNIIAWSCTRWTLSHYSYPILIQWPYMTISLSCDQIVSFFPILFLTADSDWLYI